jgi:hypothetical protein
MCDYHVFPIMGRYVEVYITTISGRMDYVYVHLLMGEFAVLSRALLGVRLITCMFLLLWAGILRSIWHW